jgi:hypothetical protein
MEKTNVLQPRSWELWRWRVSTWLDDTKSWSSSLLIVVTSWKKFEFLLWCLPSHQSHQFIQKRHVLSTHDMSGFMLGMKELKLNYFFPSGFQIKLRRYRGKTWHMNIWVIFFLFFFWWFVLIPFTLFYLQRKTCIWLEKCRRAKC